MNLANNHLLKLGFSEKEATVFESLVCGGRATPSGLAERSGINRSTIYIILESLKEKGAVIELERDRNSLYIPVSAEQFKRIFFEKAEEAKHRLSLAETTSEILEKYGTVKKFGLEFYEGEEELKRLYREILEPRMMVLRIMDPGRISDELWEEFLFLEKTCGREVFQEIILADCSRSIELSQRNQEEKRTTLVIPLDPEFFLFEIIITHNSVVKIDHEKQYAVIDYGERSVLNARYIIELVWTQIKGVGRVFVG